MSNTKTEKIIVIERLKEICEECAGNSGYGYRNFCDKYEITWSAFSRVMYEKKGDFSLKLIYKIAKATGVSIDWLLGLSDRKYIEV